MIPERIERALDKYSETKAIFLINPNNLTGQYFTKAELEKVVHIAIGRNLIVIVDEIFHKFVFDHENRFIGMTAIEAGDKCVFEQIITWDGNDS